MQLLNISVQIRKKKIHKGTVDVGITRDALQIVRKMLCF